ncbi:uncharacterized protein LOC105838264 [Monomorium pharaonis]|uniref:uncharacterized protein LOC118644112 n=1 Tax=Monomorium pharaonis TaxID=307658 RepID=UPI00063F9C91|nr:uncharacterized protein LOC118644112 [Monomorium pharaonis]XP_036150379.1 uncharacterized protein LOC105838264 [Monomorium pharaonis]
MRVLNLSGNSWKEIRHKRVITFIPKWQNCSMNRYYTMNRILLLCVGLWPYQKSSSKYIIIPFMTIMLTSGVIAQLMTFVTTEYSTDILLHILTYTIPWLGYTLKYNALCLNMKQMRDLMERVCCDWNELNNIQEIEIIKEYSAFGRFITLVLTLFMYTCISCFILVQFLSNILIDIMSSKNESHLRQFPILIECFIDQQKYFFPILLQLCVVVICGLTTVLAAETINMLYTQHVCGLFEIASYRIEQALHPDIIQSIAPTKRNSMIYQEIINGFNMYRRATEFMDLLKINIKRTYSLLLPLGVLSLSINLYRFSRLIDSKDYYEMIVSFIFIIGHFGYMLFGNYLGQKIIDHSSDIFYKTYNVQWYTAPLRAQKLLLLVMQRGMRHCTIVIGGLFIPSFEGFATLTSMSISYFAMILSLF